MQITEMRTLRSLCLHKRFISHNPSKATNYLSFRFVSRHSPQISRHFCVAGEFGSAQTDHGAEEGPRGWSMYKNVDGGLFSDKIGEKSSIQVSPPGSDGEENFGFSVIDEKFESFEVQGRYGEGKDGKLSNGGKNPKAMSDSDSEVNVFSKEKPEWSVKKVNLGNGLGLNDIVGSKKKGKSKAKYVCEECGHSEGQWWGMCPSCGASAKMKRFYEEETNTKRSMFSEKIVKSWLPQVQEDLKPVRLRDVVSGVNNHHWRIPLSGTFGNEVARVLGGGLVPGSLVLIGGDPGVGKSTLLLQMAAIIAEGQTQGPVVYVSGEESIEQISSRADRMEIGAEDLFLYSSTDIEDILTQIQPLSPRALVIDSIQTVYLNEVSGSAGGLNQVKECTSALLRFAKKTNIPVLLVGHVTKSGDIAGPRVLEHIVDVVLYLEGEKYSSHRLLRAVKNRFGSIDELGIFEMAQLGLQAVTNPSAMFLSGDQRSDSEFLAGLAVAVVMDASRTFLIEIQALCLSGSTSSRHVNGIQGSRADMIISVLIKQAGLKIQENAVFLNVVSGVMLTETAGDLAIAAAICSSFLECPIPVGIAFIGEIGLAGELRMVPRMDKRVNTVAQLRYKKCIIPKSAEKSLAILELEDMELIGCANLKEVINIVFR